MNLVLKETLDDSRQILKETWHVIKRLKWWVLGLVIGLAVFTAVLFPHDPALHRRITEDRIESLVKISNRYRRWGDFRDTVTITLVVFGAGLLARRRSWRTAAVACFISASLAGLSVNAVRFTAGRPRPSAEMQDGFYGPTFKYRMQSFPSGHAGTSTGNAAALVIALPGAGVPVLLLSASGVVWSSLYSRTHYVSDVTVGMLIGLFYGIVAGGIARRMMKSRSDPSGSTAGNHAP